MVILLCDCRSYLRILAVLVCLILQQKMEVCTLSLCRLRVTQGCKGGYMLSLKQKLQHNLISVYAYDISPIVFVIKKLLIP